MSARLTHIRMVDKHTYHISCYNTHMPLLPTLNLDQITVWLTDEVITPWVWETLRELLPGQMTFCSWQQLLQSHLTIREQVNFQASLYGDVPQAEWEQLLERSSPPLTRIRTENGHLNTTGSYGVGGRLRQT